MHKKFLKNHVSETGNQQKTKLTLHDAIYTLHGIFQKKKGKDILDVLVVLNSGCKERFVPDDKIILGYGLQAAQRKSQILISKKENQEII